MDGNDRSNSNKSLIKFMLNIIRCNHKKIYLPANAAAITGSLPMVFAWARKSFS